MADQLIEHLANHHGKVRILSEAEDKPATNHHHKHPEPLIMKQPNFATNPLLRQVKRRPAQLNLSKDIPAPSSGTRSTPSKPLSAMSVREKILHGISMDMRRLQKSPASFDRVFPSKPAASTTKPHQQQQQQQRARASTEKLFNTLHHGAVELQDDETEEARRFEKQLRDVNANTQDTLAQEKVQLEAANRAAAVDVRPGAV
ncbi:hypothetical protein BBO_06822 [Beauveria brongniartii RCEF 3172]|uniref:Uncharacterized protein n=1 Tax=Beauveria brongniartii RCEF 3172 TaxID=1081107 RepID=A0A167AJ95_9HYPO|nr:hypothetical protein BBO_06822 [Beauveria brongniartii RCEF 3172]